jgi:YD repeat-containing protein
MAITDYSYNRYGQLVGVWYPDHSCHRLVWNERGQLLEEQLPNGGSSVIAMTSLAGKWRARMSMVR